MPEITQRAFGQVYADVPADQRERLARFRADNPPKFAFIDGVEWNYIDAGHGPRVVLLLVGGLRLADAAFRSIEALLEPGDSGEAYRVIAPSYPALSTMAALADGIAMLLELERIESVYVLAGSFGGMLAQVLARRHPGRIGKLILSTTSVNDAHNADRYRQALAMIEPMPPEAVSELAQSTMLATIHPPESEMAFWKAYLDELYNYRVDKAALISTYHCLLDFAEHYHLTPDDLRDWPGEILILESDDDATFNEDQRAAVRAVYPQAKTYVFHGAGHSPGTTQRELYFRVVKDFLRG
jgi:pimeloyl-ACP methyl ester carboxylesterase